jgi:hypothetical protein
MAALANKVCDNPVFLPLLDVFNSQSSQLGPPQTTAQQNRERGVIALSPKTCTVHGSQKALALLRRKPISNRYAQSLGTFYSANSSSQIRTEETAISSLVSQPSDGGQTKVDGR